MISSFIDPARCIILANPIYKPSEERMIDEDMVHNPLADLVEVQIHGTAVVNQHRCGAAGFYIVGVRQRGGSGGLCVGDHILCLRLFRLVVGWSPSLTATVTATGADVAVRRWPPGVGGPDQAATSVCGSVTGSRMVWSPKSATRSRRPPRAWT